MKDTITIDYTIDFLNQLIRTDSFAIAELIANRAPCNKNMANHPTVQVGIKNDEYCVGFLGVLNGLFGIDDVGYGPITIIFDNDGKIVRAQHTYHHPDN